MRRPRPYVPLSARVLVAARQLHDRIGYDAPVDCLISSRSGDAEILAYLLRRLGFVSPQLDHDPALILRKFNPRTGKYTPDANATRYLVYRERAAHQQKTTGRKPGAERTITTKGSDVGLKAKFARLEGKPKRTVKIPSRPFPKQGRRFR
jgi:hypothetical protein